MYTAIFATIGIILGHSGDNTLYAEAVSQTESVLKTIPKHLVFNNKKLGFILTHYQIIKDFDQKSISKVNIEPGQGGNTFAAKVTVTNKINQKIVYQVSTDTDYYWNRVWGYHGNLFYKLYDYYPSYTYTNINSQTKNKKMLLKMYRKYDAQGRPGYFSNPPHDVSRIEFTILKVGPLIKTLKQIDVDPNGSGEIKISKEKFVLMKQYDSQNKQVLKENISSRDYWEWLYMR